MLEIGKAIRIIRQAKNIKQGDLAKGAGLSSPFLCLIENGERQPSLAVVRKIAHVLGVPSEVLILLAQPRQGTLHSNDDFAADLVQSIRSMVEVQDTLRAKLDKGGKS